MALRDLLDLLVYRETRLMLFLLLGGGREGGGGVGVGGQREIGISL